MADIHVLSPVLANQIAAGEVVERPASVVKELVENSIDAGANCISVSITDGGISSIVVTDNGCGIKSEQCSDAFLRHATSKITSIEDLSSVSSLGFRGEALASIAAVACVTLTTREKESDTGMSVCVDGGLTLFAKQVACPEGTTIKVENLFARIPARLRFLKSPRFEAGHCADFMSRMVLAHPEISFRYIQDGKTIYESYGDNDLKNAIYSVYGNHVFNHLLPVLFDDGYIKIDGFIGTQEISYANRNLESFFVNGRFIRSSALSNSVENAYLTKIMTGRFPFSLIRITIAAKEVDVNIHPSKTQIKFANESRVLEAVLKSCSAALKPAVVPSLSIHASSELKNNTVAPIKAVPIVPVKEFIESPKTTEKSENRNIADSIGIHYYDVNKLKMEASTNIETDPRHSYEYNDFEIKSMKSSTPVYQISVTDKSSVVASPKKDIQQSLPISKEYTLVGCVFNTYWIIEYDNNLFLIDQHAACERKLYEKYMSQEQGSASQNLLIPKNLTLSPNDFETAEKYRTELEKIGFIFFKKDSFTYSVEAVPFINGKLFDPDYLCEAIGIIEKSGKSSQKELIYESLVSSSCKHSIKAGDRISREEMIHLIDQFVDNTIPLTCPHGRPVIIKLSKEEIEKGFKRIV